MAVDLILIVKSNIIIIMMNTDKKIISFYLEFFKNSKNWRILGLSFGLNLINFNT